MPVMQCWRACGSMIWAGKCQTTLEPGPEAAVVAVQAAAPGAERAAGPARAGISGHRAGGDAGRDHHRHQHGRRVPRHHAGTTSQPAVDAAAKGYAVSPLPVTRTKAEAHAWLLLPLCIRHQVEAPLPA